MDRYKPLHSKQRKMLEVILNDNRLLHVIAKARNLEIDNVQYAITTTLNANEYDDKNKSMLNIYRKYYLEYRERNK